MKEYISSESHETAAAENRDCRQILALTDLQSDLDGPRCEQVRTELMTYMNGLEQTLRQRITTRLRPQDYEICTAAVNAAVAAQAVLARQDPTLPDNAGAQAPTL